MKFWGAHSLFQAMQKYSYFCGQEGEKETFKVHPTSENHPFQDFVPHILFYITPKDSQVLPFFSCFSVPVLWYEHWLILSSSVSDGLRDDWHALSHLEGRLWGSTQISLRCLNRRIVSVFQLSFGSVMISNYMFKCHFCYLNTHHINWDMNWRNVVKKLQLS